MSSIKCIYITLYVFYRQALATEIEKCFSLVNLSRGNSNHHRVRIYYHLFIYVGRFLRYGD